jgi:hypothetical protein
MVNFNANFSRNILLRLAAALLLLCVAVAMSYPFIEKLYFENQLTQIGLTINGIIVGLFFLGTAKLAAILLYYVRQERTLAAFLENIKMGDTEPALDLDPDALIVQRVQAMRALGLQHAPINHSALAATLLADLSTRTSFPRFINNILILTGVFGTIVSLSIALIGASNLLQAVGQGGDMGMVVHGMSTALSTTITAIVSYVIFGYFFIKLNDAQSHLLSGIEQTTSLYLMPKYSATSDSLLERVAQLVDALQKTADQMLHAQAGYTEAGQNLRETIADVGSPLRAVSGDLSTLKRIMREGFRLPESGD